MLKIAIVDDHALFRKSLKLLIDSFDNMKVFLEASNGIELLEKLEVVAVDIVLLDLQMPEMDGFETCEKLKEYYPEIKILVLTYLNDLHTMERIVKIGVEGFFTKNTPPKELKEAISRLEDNGFYFEKSIAPVIHQILSNPTINNKLALDFTPREIEVIRFTAKGYRAKEIADLLHISSRTVEVHKRNLIEKVDAKSFMEVIIYALTHNFILLEELE